VQQGIRRLVLDVLKPHEPNLTELATRLSSISGIDGVNISLVEIDQNTESVRITIEGDNIDLTHVETTVKDCGADIHSVDEVAVGTRLVQKVN
jgi:hypothetical protein